MSTEMFIAFCFLVLALGMFVVALLSLRVIHDTTVQLQHLYSPSAEVSHEKVLTVVD